MIPTMTCLIGRLRVAARLVLRRSGGMVAMRQFRVAVVVALAVGAAAPMADAIPITSGLVAYWAGDGNANDTSGNGNDGTLIGSAGFGPGISGQAFNFTGGKMMADAAALPTGGSNRTIAFHVSSDNFAVGNTFLGGWGTPADNQMSAMMMGRFNQQNRRSAFWGFDNDLDAIGTLADGAWHHLAFTLQGTSATIYIDGAFDNSQTLSGLNTPGGTMFYLGDSSTFLNAFTGRIDEVAVYDRALSGGEVATLATAVPEPATWLLTAIGGVSLLLGRLKLRQS